MAITKGTGTTILSAVDVDTDVVADEHERRLRRRDLR